MGVIFCLNSPFEAHLKYLEKMIQRYRQQPYNFESGETLVRPG